MFTVVWVYQGREFTHRSDQLVVLIGRAPDNDVRLADRFASEHHCMVIHVAGHFFLKDRNSRNGTRLDRRWVRGEVPLVPGQEILIGETLIRILLDHHGGNRKGTMRIVPIDEPTEVTPPHGVRAARYVTSTDDFYPESTPIPDLEPMGTSVPPPPVRPFKTPTRASLRLMIDQVVLHASELRALLVDHFPKLAQQASSEMDRLSVVSLLLERESAVEILRCLQFAFPEACAEHWPLLRWE